MLYLCVIFMKLSKDIYLSNHFRYIFSSPSIIKFNLFMCYKNEKNNKLIMNYFMNDLSLVF